MEKLRPCNTCPFREGTENIGSHDWLNDVMNYLVLKNLEHTCHKTDPRADGYLGHKEGKDSVCIGSIAMLKKSKNTCYDERIVRALLAKKINWDQIPTEGVFKKEKDFFFHHLNGIVKESKNDKEKN